MTTNRGRAYKCVAHKNIFIYKNSKKSKSQIVWKTTKKIEKYNKITKCQKSKSLAEAWCYAACMAMSLSLVSLVYLALASGCLGLQAGQRKLKISSVYSCVVHACKYLLRAHL